MPDSSSPDILELLRDFQSRAVPANDRLSFDEYQMEKARGGNLANINPGVGFMGHLNTSSFAPTGPNYRSSGNQAVGYNGRNYPNANQQQYGVPSGASYFQGQSKYQFDRPNQPTPWITDVDMESVWYSPMEPVWPFGPPYYTRPREWNYPVGYNLNYIPKRLELINQLRGMRSSWGLLSTVIETRKDQLLRLPWTIQRKDKPRASAKTVDQMRKFFRRPDGKLSFGQWSRKLMDDLFVCDSPCIYLDRDLAGKVRHAEILDGGTIFPLIDDAGRRPDNAQPAFQQIIYGLPMINLSEDELIYAMMRPRPELPMFGYSPVEQIMIEATEGIRKTFYQLEFWRSGSMPELVVTVPDAWSPRQIAVFQAHFDALLSGQLSLKSKVRFLPGGMKPFDIKNASGESLWSQRDELLARLVCFAFSIPPTPFVRQMNRATAQNAQQTAQEEGLYPLMSWWKDDIMDCIIQEKFGYDDIEFTFLPRPEVDLEKQAKIHQIKIQTGEMTLNEARDENGQEPYEGDLGSTPLVYFGSGAVPLKDVISGTAMLPGSPAGNNTGNNDSGKPGGSKPPAVGGVPMRGPAKPHEASPQPSTKPTPVHKVTGKELNTAADGATEDLDTLSDRQIHAGNYPKGHISIQGLDISIENNTGSKRGEKRQDDKKRWVTMPSPYGYIRGTIGADKSQVDVYLGPKPESTTVWVIDQDKVTRKKGKNQGFDEHKVMLGYNSLKDAVKDYESSHFDGHGHERIKHITELSIKDLKSWLQNGDTKEPIFSQGFGEVVKFIKSDTISTATGLNFYSQLGSKKKKRKKRKLPSGPRWLNLIA